MKYFIENNYEITNNHEDKILINDFIEQYSAFIRDSKKTSRATIKSEIERLNMGIEYNRNARKAGQRGCITGLKEKASQDELDANDNDSKDEVSSSNTFTKIKDQDKYLKLLAQLLIKMKPIETINKELRDLNDGKISPKELCLNCKSPCSTIVCLKCAEQRKEKYQKEIQKIIKNLEKKISAKIKPNEDPELVELFSQIVNEAIEISVNPSSPQEKSEDNEFNGIEMEEGIVLDFDS